MYDDIIIGAGSAGAVIAARLSEDPERQVLLIEAGPDYSRIEDLPDDLVKPWISWVDHDWGFRGTARQGRDFPMYRGKVMGGTSAINGAIALRGVPADFDAWVELGCDQWSYEDVLPWYRKLESDPEGGDFHGTNGPVPIERSPKDAWQPTHRAFYDACREQGFDDVWDHNRPEATGVGPWPRNKRDGLRISTNIAYLMNIRDRKNLTIRHGVMVDRVRLEHGRATGVVLADGSVVEARRVCISAGAIVTPAILLRSGIGPAEKLAPHGIEQLNALPGVGENLTDHVAIGVGGKCETRRDPRLRRRLRGRPALHRARQRPVQRHADRSLDDLGPGARARIRKRARHSAEHQLFRDAGAAVLARFPQAALR